MKCRGRIPRTTSTKNVLQGPAVQRDRNDSELLLTPIGRGKNVLALASLVFFPLKNQSSSGEKRQECIPLQGYWPPGKQGRFLSTISVRCLPIPRLMIFTRCTRIFLASHRRGCHSPEIMLETEWVMEPLLFLVARGRCPVSPLSTTRGRVARAQLARVHSTPDDWLAAFYSCLSGGRLSASRTQSLLKCPYEKSTEEKRDSR